MAELKLFMVLLGCRPQGRHVEQHDFFFGIARSMKELVPEIKAFWNGSGEIHVDGWREVTMVEDHHVRIRLKEETPATALSPRLFFINLGGYIRNKFEEQHYALLTVKESKAEAFKTAKETLFYKNTHFDAAKSHVDDRYGIDVDDLYEIDEVLPANHKISYQIELSPKSGRPEDNLHLGYFKLSSF